jgi:hypothetical protein
MSLSRPPFILVVATLAVSLGLGTGVTLQAEDRTKTDPTADTELGSPSPTQVAGDAAVPLDQPFALAVGETAVVEGGLDVKFASVVGDSRCPADVLCVWEGNAEISIDVAMTGEDQASLRLNTNPSFATEATYLSYTIEFMALEPYPRTDSETDEPYRATLVASLTRTPSAPTPSASPSPVVLVDA